MQLSKLKVIFPKNKKTLIVIGLIVCGLLLAVFAGGKGAENSEAVTLAEYKENMEKELEKLCSSVSGVGKCEVTLSFSRGEEIIYKSGKQTETKPPEVMGVAIACRGADSARVRQDLTELFTSLYDIPSNRVAILKLN